MDDTSTKPTIIMPEPAMRPKLRFTRYKPSLHLRICYPNLYRRIKDDFGSIPGIMDVLGRCPRHKLEALTTLVHLIPPSLRLRVIEADDGRDFFLEIQEVCSYCRSLPSKSPHTLFHELFKFYNLECDFAVDTFVVPDGGRGLKRTISIEKMV